MIWAIGQKIKGGDYVIEQVLGQGGFGITYKALQLHLNRPVVIKTPTPNKYLYNDPEYDKYIERFIAEGKILARLSQDSHPHIVGVIELFQEGNTHCLVMEFVQGENLFQLVQRRGALPEAEIVTYIHQIGEALTVVHKAKLVHRDAHPENIMLRNNGKAVLIDFGIAKEIVPSSTSIAGHKGFAPYEQICRGSREPTVDVYCLAATLYYAVTGQKPETSLARKLDNIPLIQPQQIISTISDGLNQAILKGMALEAKDRPQSMQEWLAMLEAAKETLPPGVDQIHRKEVVRSQEKSKSVFTFWDELQPIQRKANTDSEAALDKPTKIIPWGWLAVFLLLYTLTGYLLNSTHAALMTGLGAIILFAIVMALVLVVNMGNVNDVMVVQFVATVLILAVAVYFVRSAIGSIVESVAWTMAIAGSIVIAGATAWNWAVGVYFTGALVIAVAVGVVVGMPVAETIAIAVARTIGVGVTEARSVDKFVIELVGISSGIVAALLVGLLMGLGAIYFPAKCRDELRLSFSKFHTFLILAVSSAIGLGVGCLGGYIFK